MECIICIGIGIIVAILLPERWLRKVRKRLYDFGGDSRKTGKR